MADLLVDTDIFIDHLRGASELKPGRHRLHYSVITRCELLSGDVGSALVQRLLDPFREIAVDRAVAARAGRLRRETGVSTPDALIAATAIEHGLVLVTRNRKDFEAVKQLRIRNPTRETAPAAGPRLARRGTRRHLHARRERLRRYAGWTADDFMEFDTAMRAQRVVDARLWE